MAFAIALLTRLFNRLQRLRGGASYPLHARESKSNTTCQPTALNEIQPDRSRAHPTSRKKKSPQHSTTEAATADSGSTLRY